MAGDCAGVSACIIFFDCVVLKNLTIPKSAHHISLLVAWIALQSLVVENIYITQALLPYLYLGWAALLIVAGWLRQQLTQEKAIS